MRVFFNSIIILVVIFCAFTDFSMPFIPLNTNLKSTEDSLCYKVYKLDSIHSYYLIYAKKGDRLIKIISPKISAKGDSIIIGKSYKFKLQSILTVNGKYIVPATSAYEFSGWRIDDSTTIYFEDNMVRDFFYADNVKGLFVLAQECNLKFLGAGADMRHGLVGWRIRAWIGRDTGTLPH